MKTIFTFIMLFTFGFALQAQLSLPVTFENAEEDTAWNQFANAGDDPANFVLTTNPDAAGINASDYCIMFNVLANADPWVGAWSDAYGTMDLTAENHVLTMMVYKDVISNAGLKFEGGGYDPIELKVPNTKTEEWELISFDFTNGVGRSYTRLVFFPDFPDSRTAGSVAYIDNIGFANSSTNLREVDGITLTVYPNPATDKLAVKYPGIRSITVSNMIGQKVKEFRFPASDQKVIYVSDLNDGIYFLTMETEKGEVSAKFVKK